jgi:hypothetical protein
MHSINNRKVICFFLAIFFLGGCSKDNFWNGNSKIVNTYFTFVPAEFGSISTRAGVAVDENSVVNLWVLQFDGTTDGSKLLRSEYKATVENLADLQIVLNQGVNHRVIFIANTFDSSLFSEANAPLNTYTLLQFKEKAFSLADENGMFTGETTKYLRMYGSYVGDIPNKSSSITLYRICSKVHINYISEDVSSVEDGVRFRITSVQLKNVPASSSYISNPTNSAVFSPPSVIDYPVTTGTLIGTTEESYSIGDYEGSVTYYMPENIAGINSSVGSQILKSIYAPAKATYLELKGEGIGNDGRVNEYATFKFYLGNNLTTDYNVNTNTNYSFTVRFKGLNIKDMRLEIIRVSDIEVIVEEEWI